jgi:hypothetical protein
MQRVGFKGGGPGNDGSDTVQAAAKAVARAGVGSQIDNYQEASFLPHIDQERLLLYQLLAGQVDDVTPALNLDWRRAFGLHYWCASTLTASSSCQECNARNIVPTLWWFVSVHL